MPIFKRVPKTLFFLKKQAFEFTINEVDSILVNFAAL